MSIREGWECQAGELTEVFNRPTIISSRSIFLAFVQAEPYALAFDGQGSLPLTCAFVETDTLVSTHTTVGSSGISAILRLCCGSQIDEAIVRRVTVFVINIIRQDSCHMKVSETVGVMPVSIYSDFEISVMRLASRDITRVLSVPYAVKM